MKAKKKRVSCSLLFSLISLLSVCSADAKELTASSDPADLRAYVEQINRTARPSVDQLAAQGNAYDWLKDYQSAANVFSTVIKLCPNEPEYYAHRGVMYKQMRKFPLALKDLDRAESLGFEELKPQMGVYLQARGVALEKPGRKKEAKVDFEKARELGWK